MATTTTKTTTKTTTPLLLPLTHRYVHNFKYCTSCELWFASGEEAYRTEEDRTKQRHPRCPDPSCKQWLKSRPRSAKAKERLSKLTNKPIKRY
ncbi:MAG: hypothetical protein M3275_00225 [Thermoproteota archaeon]|nr:hypothetical protein [Thermoproteota archaeon]